MAATSIMCTNLWQVALVTKKLGMGCCLIPLHSRYTNIHILTYLHVHTSSWVWQTLGVVLHACVITQAVLVLVTSLVCWIANMTINTL